MTVFILMGVSGSGKSTIGGRVAQELGLEFIDGDDYHPPANVEKMSAGIPLTDVDRGPWIDALATAINSRQPRRDAIVACSALTEFVRNRLRASVSEPLRFILLHADPAVIQRRLEERGQHFMKAGMLGSQLAALELPADAVVIDVSRPLHTVCADVADRIRHSQ